MSNRITIQETLALPFIELVRFAPDCDDHAEFLVHVPGGKAYNASVHFGEGELRHYVFESQMPANLRAAALEAVEILIDESFADESQFNEDEEDPNVIYVAVHQMTRNYGLYTNMGRPLLSMQEA